MRCRYVRHFFRLRERETSDCTPSAPRFQGDQFSRPFVTARSLLFVDELQSPRARSCPLPPAASPPPAMIEPLAAPPPRRRRARIAFVCCAGVLALHVAVAVAVGPAGPLPAPKLDSFGVAFEVILLATTHYSTRTCSSLAGGTIWAWNVHTSDLHLTTLATAPTICKLRPPGPQ